MVFACNVAGSVTGALAGGFFFPGRIGMWGTVFLAGTLAIFCTAFPLSSWKAGRLMGEFTLLLSEQRESEAMAVQKKLVETLGAEVARSIFGG